MPLHLKARLAATEGGMPRRGVIGAPAQAATDLHALISLRDRVAAHACSQKGRLLNTVLHTSLVRPLRGFSIIELVVVLAIIGVLTAIAAKRLGAFHSRYSTTASYSSLSAMDRAAEMYFADYQDLPPDRNQGVYPTEFGDYLSRQTFLVAPPLPGAAWDWNGRNRAPWSVLGANFSIWIQPRPAGLWEDFDARHDDGNLSTGTLRLLNGDKNYCLIRQ